MAKWIAIAVLLALVAGCGSKEETRAAAPAPQPTATLDPGDEDVEEEYDQPPKPASGGIGDTITLTGSNVGVRLRVTVAGVRPAGRFLAVKLRLKNTGIAVFESEMRGAFVRYADGSRGRVAFGVKAACSHGFQRHIRIDVGLRTRGCVLFRRPSGAKPRTMKLALESEPVQQGGLWRLG